MPRRELKVPINCQQQQIVMDAKLRKQRVDGPDLHPGASASVAQFGGVDVVLAVCEDER
jgi:hypothetical protein